MTDAGNLLYYGDNLDVLRRHVKDETVDLVYLDPPFNSNATYNVLFKEQNGTEAAAQIQAFGDTWRWDTVAAQACQEMIEAGGKLSEAMQAFRLLLGNSNMLAYLAMMAPRLVELRRVLKPTGSIYLHCDPTASHYLKVLMDAVFGPENFRNDVIWKRSHGHNSARRYGNAHDSILFFGKSDSSSWNPVFHQYDETYLDKHYGHVDVQGRRYKHENPTGAGISHGATGQPWKGIDPTAKGRHWAKSPTELERLDAEGLIYWPSKVGAWPYIKVYLDAMQGPPAQDVWTDVPVINMMAKERLGYPTQKPEALLERIILASSKNGDTVLDPFCGCGTAIAVAQQQGRRWIGIDITHLAITLIKHRLHDAFGDTATYKTIGEPVSMPDAETLAKQDPYQFQWWALGLVGARPVEQKKGADHGIDGRLYFHDDTSGDQTKHVVLSVKAGHTSVPHVRDLLGVLDREKAAIGVLIALQEPTTHMRSEVAGAGFYHSPVWDRNYARLQILTIAELLDGKTVDMPPLRQVSTTFKRAPKAKPQQGVQLGLPQNDD